MTDNRTTELLRKLLDERGVKHKDYAFVVPETQERFEVTRIRDYAGRFKARFMSCGDPGKVDVSARLTPERAIAATLGSGTCSIVKTWSDSDYVDDWRYRCSECGGFIPVNERDPDTGDVINAANYCPNCGARVKGGGND